MLTQLDGPLNDTSSATTHSTWCNSTPKKVNKLTLNVRQSRINTSQVTHRLAVLRYFNLFTTHLLFQCVIDIAAVLINILFDISSIYHHRSPTHAVVNRHFFPLNDTKSHIRQSQSQRQRCQEPEPELQIHTHTTTC